MSITFFVRFLPYLKLAKCTKSISLAEYVLNPERLNVDSSALGSECHTRSGLEDFQIFRHNAAAVLYALNGEQGYSMHQTLGC